MTPSPSYVETTRIGTAPTNTSPSLCRQDLHGRKSRNTRTADRQLRNVPPFGCLVGCRLPPCVEQVDDIRFNIEPGRCLDEEISERPVVRRQEGTAVEPIPIQHPARQQQGGTLVAFTERLRPSDAIGENSGRPNWIIDVVDFRQRSLDPFEVVRLIPPLVILSDSAVERDSQTKRGTPQWSCRYARRSRYSWRRSSSQARSSSSSTSSCSRAAGSSWLT